MARSRRRTGRRTTTQRAAGLIALALPAPVQRVADTRLGSLLMLVGAPVAIMFGLLNVTWVDGFPTFTFNRNKAVELRNVASQQINNLENEAISQNWGQTTVELLHAAQGPNHDHQLPFPSTRPQTTNSTYNTQQATYPAQPYGQQTQYTQQQYPAAYQQQQYPAGYSQQQYPATYQQPSMQPYQQGYSQTYQQQPPQVQYQQPYAAQPSRASQQPAQQWQYGNAQQPPYQANNAAYGQGLQGGYTQQQYNYPMPSSANNSQGSYPGPGQYVRY
jgi:hypothetical protein